MPKKHFAKPILPVRTNHLQQDYNLFGLLLYHFHITFRHSRAGGNDGGEALKVLKGLFG